LTPLAGKKINGTMADMQSDVRKQKKSAPASDVSNVVLAALDAAIETTKLGDLYSNIRSALALGYSENVPGRREIVRSRNGTPRETWRYIWSQIPEDHKEAKAQLEEKQADWRRVYQEYERVAAKTGNQLHQEHLEDLSRRILESQPLPDGFNADEFSAEREALISAYKKALFQITLDAHAIALPLLQSAADTARRLLIIELNSEIARSERFGIPMESRPSEYLLVLKAAIEIINSRLQRPARQIPPAYYLEAFAI
jgi:hypothetical protein